MSAPMLLRPKDAAAALSISLSRVYQLIASGDLATVRIGGGSRAAHRIERTAVDAFIERNRIPSSNCESNSVEQSKTIDRGDLT